MLLTKVINKSKKQIKKQTDYNHCGYREIKTKIFSFNPDIAR